MYALAVLNEEARHVQDHCSRGAVVLDNTISGMSFFLVVDIFHLVQIDHVETYETRLLLSQSDF